MCGIAGIWSAKGFSGKELAEICLGFSKELSHRGPDDEGFVLFTETGKAEVYGGIDSHPALQLPHISAADGKYIGALVHRRLSIISPGKEGHQPMHTDDNKHWIVYNGETFNYKELDVRYRIKNQSNNDAETVLKLCANVHTNGHGELDGFHAFAIYNTESKKLKLFRDRTGVNPLYFAQHKGYFAFASETKALRKWAGIKNVNSEAVFRFLTEGMQIPALEMVEGITEIPYELEWNFSDTKTTLQYVQEDLHQPDISLEKAVSHAVESRLMADVPLGFAVSGGLDSAIIIGAARKELGPDADLKLFSIVSDDAQSDESLWQEKVAVFNHAEWHKTNTADFTADLLQTVTAATDMPSVAWNNIAQFELARSAKAGGITVFLNGQGADEIFGGYPDYLFRYFLKYPWRKCGNNLPLSGNEIRLGSLKLLMKRVMPAFLRKAQFLRLQEGWISPELEIYDPFEWKLSKFNAEEKMYLDYTHQRLRQMLRWEDLNGMAHQLESRNPFADNAVLASWLNVSMEKKMTNGFTKGILRDAVNGIVPEDVRWRVDKKGFSVPDASLTWKHHMAWQEAFMSRDLDVYSPFEKREAAWKNMKQGDEKTLRWFFRLTSLSYYLENLKR
jgi:asparagine synthase (glutamine-hydrolysing)